VSAPYNIVTLDEDETLAAIDALADVLVDCVEGGASVSFMLPFRHEEATAFFQGVARAIEHGSTVLLAARLHGRIVGTVQLGLAMPPNQPHRAEVKKLLVHRAARHRGIGAALMARLETEALARGRTLLVLDTAADSAERLYARMGWVRVGIIPGYALLPDGRPCDTVIFWKRLS
jgi:GNAT superfamily N-acetyltransferase